MDYALLAATALGGVALYLMLPRERASLVKLGILLAVLAFGGLFLYMFRGLATSAGGVSTVDPYFYIFAGIMVAGTLGVICQPKPVYAALYFVLVTLAGSGLFVMMLAEFMAIVLVIIYAGAILVTYVFVIMLASQSTSGTGGEARSPLYDREAAEPFVATLISFILLGAVLQCLYPTEARAMVGGAKNSDARMVRRIEDAVAAVTPGKVNEATVATPQPGTIASTATASSTEVAAATAASTQGAAKQTAIRPQDRPMGDTQLLGNELYGRYALSLELAGVLLTIALIGAVVIARKEAPQPSLGTGQVPLE